MTHKILITGSEGYLGKRLAARLSVQHQVLGIDIRGADSADYRFIAMDIRDPKLVDLLREHQVNTVIHLASVMKASDDPQRDYDIDVGGTRNVLQACVAADVTQLVVTSSGAAYGYHADNAAWLTEEDPLRGNDSFAYSRHKRLIEEMLAEYRRLHPQLAQLVLRPGTVLGTHTANQITDLFARRSLLAIAGSDSPFVFIWDEDVVNIIVKGVNEGRSGCFNLAGNGCMTIREIAQLLNKPVTTLPAWLLWGALWLGSRLGLSQYTEEQLKFLRYRPVLDNQALKNAFGYQPQKTSKEAFEFFLSHHPELCR